MGSVWEIFLPIVWIADEMTGFRLAYEKIWTNNSKCEVTFSPTSQKKILVQYQTKAFTSAIIKSI